MPILASSDHGNLFPTPLLLLMSYLDIYVLDQTLARSLLLPLYSICLKP
jgi:hypothetical protein